MADDRNNQADQGPGIDPISLIPLLMMGVPKQQGEGTASSMMLVVMLLPLVLRFLLPHITKMLSSIKLTIQCSRTISYSRDSSVWWTDKDNDETWNAVIQRAILKHINTKLPEVAKAWVESEVQGRKEEKEVDTAASTSASCDDSSCNGRDSSVNTYSQYHYLCAPPNGQWVDLKNGIELER
jgi:hypothetical protein